MLRFRIFILRDPDAEARGFSLQGIKVPLTTFTPVWANEHHKTFDGHPAMSQPEQEFWKIPACLLVLARPSLARHLRGVDDLWVPTSWCDIAPVPYFDPPFDRM